MEDKYLLMILQKLRERIDLLGGTIEEGSKDIESMHEYYWSNYTEMDEYGYEFFDNQQALLTQINANTSAMEKRNRFIKMLDSPYFGKVDFRYEGEDTSESYYIGIGNFSESAGNKPLIVDWRAPVSSLFYDYDKGAASYSVDDNTFDGDITSKWQYKIKGGKIIYALESDVKVDDDILIAELSGNGDVKLKNIVSTIVKEQNQIIRNIDDKILVIQGCAGSGKTSIALHRIAYLLYHERKTLKASNILILSPNGVFTDYISHILPELGEENIREMSFDVFAYRELKGIVSDCEEKYDQIERLMQFETLDAYKETGLKERYYHKQSMEFANELNGFALFLESDLMDFKDIRYKYVSKSKEDIMVLFYEKFPDIPILSRMEAVAEYIIDEAETLNGRNLDELEMAIIMESFMQMYRTTDIYTLYNEFLLSQDMPTLPDVCLAERKIKYEDVFPMLYLKYLLLRRNNKRDIKHLVIDEMQDYSYIQYKLIGKMFDCRMTILGDKAQTMEEKNNDVMKFLPKILGKNIKMMSINKSYRQTVEIATFAGSLIGADDVSYLERHGKEPQVYTFDKGDDEAVLKMCEKLSKEIDEFETIAVLTMDKTEALKIYTKIKNYLDEKQVNYGDRLNYIHSDSKEFKRGITVTTYYLAKGLEFDQVHGIYKKNQVALIHNQAKYIMATRALHELYFYET